MYEKMVKKLKGNDLPLIKLSVFSITLLLAKFWPVLLSLNWYWYLIVGVLAAIKPMKHVWS